MWRHKIYCHDTISISWVSSAVMSGDKGRRFIVLFKYNSTSFYKEVSIHMISNLPTKPI